MFFGAVFIALIAGVIGWSMRSRHMPASEQAMTDPSVELQVPASTAPARNVRMPSPFLQNRMLGINQPLLNKGAGISQAVAKGRKKLQMQYDSEPVNAAWAAHKQAALAAANDAPQISQLGAKPLAFDSTCRSSICMIGADFATPNAAQDWFTMYSLVAGPEMSRAAVQRSNNPDGTVHLQIYGFASPSSH